MIHPLPRESPTCEGREERCNDPQPCLPDATPETLRSKASQQQWEGVETNLRPELAVHLQQRLKAFGEGFRHNLALLGPPGSGKTFQLRALNNHASSDFFIVYCLLFKESYRGFLTRFLRILLQTALEDFRGSNGHTLLIEAETSDNSSLQQPDAALSFSTLLQKVETQLPKTASAIRAAEEALTRRLSMEAFNRALDVVPILSAERHQSCILILDEFLFLDELGLGHAFHELGKRVMTWPNTLFVLASSSPYRARMILRERLHLLFGQFELLTLESLDHQRTDAWLKHELMCLQGSQSWSSFLLQWLGVYPWYLSVFLGRLKEIALLQQTTLLTEALVFQAAWDVLGCPEGSLYQWCASRIAPLAHVRYGGRAIEILQQLAQGARTTTALRARIGRTALSGALQLLVEQDLVARKGTCLMVADPVLRCWLSAVLFPQRMGRIEEKEYFRAMFDQYLSSLWTQWLEHNRCSFPEQMRQLFSRFRDDTMVMDSKTGRLPRFESVNLKQPDDLESGVYLLAEGEGKRWCVNLQEGLVNESSVARFDAFCRKLSPRPSRKIVVAKHGMDPNARLLAKSTNMWVWEPNDLNILMDLYSPVIL